MIDIQVNGYDGVGFTEADLEIEDIYTIILKLQAQGVTSFLPTLFTAPQNILLRNLNLLAGLESDPLVSEMIPGFHLEGPYLSELDGPRGAHNKEWLRDPDWIEFLEFESAAAGRIKLITLAPERNGAMEMIRKAREFDITVALGHHNADVDTIEEAIRAGARLSTHLGNAAVSPMDRHLNPIWPQLAADELYASIIADGFHLTLEELKVFFRAKGVDQLILISDLTYLSGRPPGIYTWQGQSIQIHNNGKVSLPGEKWLAGASLPLFKGITNMICMGGCLLKEAIDMATINPATLLNFDNIGEIKEGKRADLILFAYNKDKIEIQTTVKSGHVVYEK